jgi:hypothetical protein
MMIKMKEGNVPTAVALCACVAGFLAMVVFDVVLNKVFDGAQWVYFIGGAAAAAVIVGIIRLALGRLPLRPWVLRKLGREN